AVASVSPEVERVKLVDGFDKLLRDLRSPLTKIAEELTATGLSDGQVLSSTGTSTYFYGLTNSRPRDALLTSGLLCTASLPVAGFGRPRQIQLSCVAGVYVYSDGNAFLFGGYHVGYEPLWGNIIGLKEWQGRLGSAMQDQAVTELSNSLNENLHAALQVFADR